MKKEIDLKRLQSFEVWLPEEEGIKSEPDGFRTRQEGAS